MAVDFNGSTSKVENTSADLSIGTVCTLSAWVRAEGLGEGGGGGVISLDETGLPTLFLAHGSTLAGAQANILSLFDDWSSANGWWNIPVTDGKWNAVAIRCDMSSVENDPEARVNFLPVTVTEIVTPVGTHGTVLPGYCVGNLTNQSLTWNGMIAHVQVFNVLLADGEMDQALRIPGSVRRGLKLWLPLYHSGYMADLSGLGNNATGTAVTNIVGGPPCGFVGSDSYVLSIGIVYTVVPASIEPGFEIKSAPLFTSSITQEVSTSEYGFEAAVVNLPQLEDLGTFGAEFGWQSGASELSFFVQGRAVDPRRISTVGAEVRKQAAIHEPRRMDR